MLQELERARPVDPCLPFQMDLSCMVDDELSENSVGRVLVHLETCKGCQEFLQSVRGQVVVHQHLADPERLSRVLSMLEESKFFPSGNTRAHLRRLAAIYYRLGKAYVMLVLDKKYQFRLLEEPVIIDNYKVRGRHFVEGVLRSGEREKGYDWVKARYLLNGRLDDEGQNLEKGQMLLNEALAVRPRFAEPRLFLALCHKYHGRIAESKELLHWVMENGRKPITRASAAIQLGALYGENCEFNKALLYSRWVLTQHLDGLEGKDRIDFGAYYNTAAYFLQMGKYERAAEYFRKLIQKYPKIAAETARYLQGDKVLFEKVSTDRRLYTQLEAVSPELVGAGR